MFKKGDLITGEKGPYKYTTSDALMVVRENIEDLPGEIVGDLVVEILEHSTRPDTIKSKYPVHSKHFKRYKP